MNSSETNASSAMRQFDYPIWLADSFEAVLERAEPTAATMDITQFAEIVRRNACVLLQARGGAGKSHTARRVCEQLETAGLWAVTVPAVRMSATSTDDLTNPTTWYRYGDNHRSDQGLNQGSGIIVVDGLNEVDRDFAGQIIDAVGPLTAMNPHISILITDRLTRRTTASPFWKYATLGPVPESKVEEITGEPAVATLTIPFYLDRYTKNTSPQEVFEESIKTVVPVSKVTHLAKAAYDSYELLQRRTLDRQATIDEVGSSVWQDMLDAEFIVSIKKNSKKDDAQGFVFHHHLLHDYLAARHLASSPQLWNRSGFDVLTMKASSFDALGLLVTLLDSRVDVDQIIELVYDWNFYGAAYVLAEDGAKARVSEPLRLAILGALAEKQFDRVIPTVVRVQDALRIQQTELARRLLGSLDRRDVIRALETVHVSELQSTYRAWFAQFSRPDHSPTALNEIQEICNEESIVGWGTANTLRRLALTSDELSELRLILSTHPIDVVRWRAAHTLGPHLSEENFAALLDTVASQPASSWITYGALRSSIEQIYAMQSTSRRAGIAALVAVLQEKNAPPGPLRGEAIRCLNVKPLPVDWHRDVEPLLEYLWETSTYEESIELADLAVTLRKRKEESYAK